MVWKQDLAKLKQVLKESGEPVPKAGPKPVPKEAPAVSRSIEEEDTMFLQAMGKRPSGQAVPKASVKDLAEPKPATAAPAPPLQAPDLAFHEAMGTLKGIKPLAPSPLEAAPVAPVPAVAPTPAPPAEASPAPVAALPEPAPEPAAPEPPATRQPERIHLAAGMAVEVDGSLDLRGHTVVDAIERFRERLQDGVFLGWRTFHVHLGNSPELQDAFQTFLTQEEAQVITRVAQAPIPMGGAQAWILYYGH